MNIKIGLLAICCFCSALLVAQQSAHELLDKSIAFHDAADNWKKLKTSLTFKVVQPDKSDGQREVSINNKKQTFTFEAQYDEGTLTYEVRKNKGAAKWNNQDEIPVEMAKKYRISAERAVMYRDYYTYLYGMPMKLKDAGTIIDPQVKQVDFYGKKYNRIRVTYTENVGEDIWYFYFNPTTNALEAYQFFHDESKNDGEYILFEELMEVQKIKIPSIRKWYYNKDEQFLGTDILLKATK